MLPMTTTITILKPSDRLSCAGLLIVMVYDRTIFTAHPHWDRMYPEPVHQAGAGILTTDHGDE